MINDVRKSQEEIIDKIFEYLQNHKEVPLSLKILQGMAKTDGLDINKFDEALAWACWDGGLVDQVENHFWLKT